MVDSKNVSPKKTATDSMKLSASQIISLGISMINVMLLSRFRSVEEYGTYSQLMIVSTIAITFFSSGFAQCINYFMANEKDDSKRSSFIKTYYSIISVIGMICGIISFAIIPLLKIYFGNANIGKYFFFLLVYPFASVINNGADRFFILYGKVNQLILFKIRHGVTNLFAITLTLVFKWDFYTYLLIVVSIELIFAILLYYFIYKITGVIPFGFDKTLCKRILTFAFPMAISALISSINSELDKLFIGGITDTETLAIYTNAAKELPITIFATSISAVVMPHIVKGIQEKDNKTAVNLWNKSIRFSSLFMCFFTVAFFVFAPQVISVLYSDKYIAGVNIFRIYLLTLPFRLTYYGMGLNAFKKTKFIMMSSIITMVSNVTLNFILYYAIGIYGPALATVISVAVMNMVQLIFTKKMLKVSFFDVYPVAHISMILVLNVILAVPFYFIQQFMFEKINFNHNFLTILLGMVWTLVYFVCIRKKAISLWKELNK